MIEALLDTDVLSEVLKRRRASTIRSAEQYLFEHQQFTFSAITLYEIERGLLANRAARLLAQFDVMVRESRVLPVSTPVLRQAARLWSDAKAGGNPRNDADLLIAASALEHDLALVTGNRRHFGWISGLRLETWE